MDIDREIDDMLNKLKIKLKKVVAQSEKQLLREYAQSLSNRANKYEKPKRRKDRNLSVSSSDTE